MFAYALGLLSCIWTWLNWWKEKNSWIKCNVWGKCSIFNLILIKELEIKVLAKDNKTYSMSLNCDMEESCAKWRMYFSDKQNTVWWILWLDQIIVLAFSEKMYVVFINPSPGSVPVLHKNSLFPELKDCFVSRIARFLTCYLKKNPKTNQNNLY